MRRLSAILLMVLMGLWLPGCSLFKKNTNSGGGGGGGDSTPNSQVPPPKFPVAEPKSDPLTGQSRAGKGNGMLAGKVLDGVNRPPAGTSILIVAMDTKEEQELAVSADGRFTAENLKKGGEYKLIARGKDGDRAVAGIAYAKATKDGILIQLKEDFVASNTPDVPRPFDSLKDEKKFEPLVPPQPKAANAKDTWQPGVDPATGEVSLPTLQVDVRPDGFSETGAGWVVPPTMEIKLPVKTSAPEFAKIAPAEVPQRAIDLPVNLGPAKVPSCVLVGRQLVNFALNDINGSPWELKADRKGKLVLLDFWGTWCGPCKQSIPTLVGLQEKYRGQGLEIIGIAYEQGGTAQEQAYRVNEVCKKLLVNYRQLLGSGSSCPVANQLHVGAYPTLILIDEQGNIIWQHDRGLTTNSREELERLIQSRTKNVAQY